MIRLRGADFSGWSGARWLESPWSGRWRSDTFQLGRWHAGYGWCSPGTRKTKSDEDFNAWIKRSLSWKVNIWWMKCTKGISNGQPIFLTFLQQHLPLPRKFDPTENWLSSRCLTSVITPELVFKSWHKRLLITRSVNQYKWSRNY